MRQEYARMTQGYARMRPTYTRPCEHYRNQKIGPYEDGNRGAALPLRLGWQQGWGQGQHYDSVKLRVGGRGGRVAFVLQLWTGSCLDQVWH